MFRFSVLSISISWTRPISFLFCRLLILHQQGQCLCSHRFQLILNGIPNGFGSDLIILMDQSIAAIDDTVSVAEHDFPLTQLAGGLAKGHEIPLHHDLIRLRPVWFFSCWRWPPPFSHFLFRRQTFCPWPRWRLFLPQNQKSSLPQTSPSIDQFSAKYNLAGHGHLTR